MKKIMVIVGSVRENRAADKVLPLVQEALRKHTNLVVDVADLKDINLPFYNNPRSPSNPQFSYDDPVTAAWGKRVAAADGFVFMTPEYNYSTSGVLKNAIDWGKDWENKPVAYVAWGVHGGIRAVEHLRQIAAWPQMIPLRDAAYINVYSAFDQDGKLLDESIPQKLDRTISQLEEALS